MLTINFTNALPSSWGITAADKCSAAPLGVQRGKKDTCTSLGE